MDWKKRYEKKKLKGYTAEVVITDEPSFRDLVNDTTTDFASQFPSVISSMSNTYGLTSAEISLRITATARDELLRTFNRYQDNESIYASTVETFMGVDVAVQGEDFTPAPMLSTEQYEHLRNE